MKRNTLGPTGFEVTELCFGALPMGPLQKNLPLAEATDLIAHALRAGINFVDTAQAYRTYAPIREAIRATGIRPVIATKSAAKTYAEMEAAVREALRELAVDCIEIFHLHAARVSPEVFAERAEALRCLLDYRARGIIGAVGISTHDVRTVMAAADHPEIEVVFPLYNREGRGILGGTVAEMAHAIRRNYEVGKGVYLMKVLAGGILLASYAEALAFVRDTVPYHAVALGMVATSEVDYNVAFFGGNPPPAPPASLTSGKKEVLVTAILCQGCGTCVDHCPNLAITMSGEKALINPEKCLRCGYCVPVCPQFAIRVV
ncbi:MAG: aldo/keto reductase [Firmicutes bacterium]|nr:aldo/keto reductase [Bacillota bacterium]